jgi:hypothetical protein
MIHGGLILPRRFLIPILLLLSSSISIADYHYASHSGSNTYPYSSWETAADTIQSAIDAADPRDTIYIGSGEYAGRTVMAAGDSLMALIGTGMDSTYLYTTNTSEVIQSGQKCLIKEIHFANLAGFTNIGPIMPYWDIQVENCLFTAGRGILVPSSIAVVRNCIFDNIHNNRSIEDVGGIQYLEVSNCLFRNLGAEPVAVFGSNVIIKNNIVLNSQGYPAFYLHYTEGGYNYICNNIITDYCCGGYYMAFTDTASRVVNNVVNNSYNNNFPTAIAMSTFDASTENNVLSNSAVGLWLVGNQRLSVHYSDFWNNIGLDLYAWNNGSFDTTLSYIHVNPMFNNPDSGDFHLQAYSPLIDAGDPNILDVDGTRSDIGAYGGPGGCSYVYLDLAPEIPDSISAHVAGDTVNIVWRRNYEADFNRYQIYRDTISGLTPSIHNMIAEPETAFYQDIIASPYSSYYYKLTSVDNQHNASDFSDELAVIFSGIPPFSQGGLPRYAVISTAYPNPFNSQINIVYSASNLGPQPPEIKLEIFDIQGRVVRTLVNERKTCGTYRAIWDGKDDHGNPVASGSYLARVSQWGMSGGDFPIKITLVK